VTDGVHTLFHFNIILLNSTLFPLRRWISRISEHALLFILPPSNLSNNAMKHRICAFLLREQFLSKQWPHSLKKLFTLVYIIPEVQWNHISTTDPVWTPYLSYIIWNPSETPWGSLRASLTTPGINRWKYIEKIQHEKRTPEGRKEEIIIFWSRNYVFFNFSTTCI